MASSSDIANQSYNKTGPDVSEETPQLRPRYVHVPRFAPGSAESVKYFQECGYVVIAGALTPEEVTKALDLTWQYLEKLGTGIDRHDPSTWVDERWPTCAHGGIVPSQGIGHSEAQWYIRSVPAVHKSFASIWGTDDLLVSFDGMAIWRPTALNPAWKTNQGAAWLHVDQNAALRPGFHCAQGMVSLLPMDPSVGGNVLIPGSHLDHFPNITRNYPERFSKLPHGLDHFRFPANDPKLNGVQMTHMEPGDMLLWDSRVVHCSSPGPETSGTAEQLRALTRVCSLVCMMPRELSSPEVLQWRKTRALEDRISTTNWTDRIVNIDEAPNIKEVKSRDDARGVVKPPLPKLTAYQKRLVGFTPDELGMASSKL
jgi:hypothetical protein